MKRWEYLMTYNCRYCDFTWNTGEGNFENVLIHEKTHKKSMSKTRLDTNHAESTTVEAK